VTTTVSPGLDPTEYNPCLVPSLPASCTAEQCQTTINTGQVAMIFLPQPTISVSRCTLRNELMVVSQFNVCQVPGLTGDYNYIAEADDNGFFIVCAPHVSKFSRCFEAWAGGTISADVNDNDCSFPIDEPELLSCTLIVRSYFTGVNIASSVLEIQILPDPAPCDPQETFFLEVL